MNRCVITSLFLSGRTSWRDEPPPGTAAAEPGLVADSPERPPPRPWPRLLCRMKNGLARSDTHSAPASRTSSGWIHMSGDSGRREPGAKTIRSQDGPEPRRGKKSRKSSEQLTGHHFRLRLQDPPPRLRHPKDQKV